MVVKTPPMGWNSWNTFGPNINEALIRETADAMVDSGLAAAGYNYLVIDDCWSEKVRDGQGRLVASAEKFPNGMKAVSDYVHSKGLKFGMYSCAGIFTCARYPSSYGYEFIDAETFASWGVDFLKYDYCNKPAGICCINGWGRRWPTAAETSFSRRAAGARTRRISGSSPPARICGARPATSPTTGSRSRT